MHVSMDSGKLYLERYEYPFDPPLQSTDDAISKYLAKHIRRAHVMLMDRYCRSPHISHELFVIIKGKEDICVFAHEIRDLDWKLSQGRLYNVKMIKWPTDVDQHSKIPEHPTLTKWTKVRAHDGAQTVDARSVRNWYWYCVGSGHHADISRC